MSKEITAPQSKRKSVKRRKHELKQLQEQDKGLNIEIGEDCTINIRLPELPECISTRTVFEWDFIKFSIDI